MRKCKRLLAFAEAMLLSMIFILNIMPASALEPALRRQTCKALLYTDETYGDIFILNVNRVKYICFII